MSAVLRVQLFKATEMKQKETKLKLNSAFCMSNAELRNCNLNMKLGS